MAPELVPSGTHNNPRRRFAFGVSGEIDEGLAQRLRELFVRKSNIEEKKMIGGLSFMASDHMCCGIVGDTLMVRVGPKNYEKCLLIESMRAKRILPVKL